jgi:DNA-binding protein
VPSNQPLSKPQKQAIQKADTLIEALGWIRRFRDTTTVIKLGGSVMEHPDSLRHLLVDIVFMSTLGMRVVVVHGGGKAISRAMDQAGIVPRFVQGRRYTDEATLAIVEKVLATEINHELAARIEEYGGRAMSLNFLSTNVLFGERLATRLAARGCAVRTGAAVASIERDRGRAVAVVTGDERLPCDGVVLAVPWKAAARLLPDMVAVGDERLAGSPITAVHLWFDRDVLDVPHAVRVGRVLIVLRSGIREAPAPSGAFRVSSGWR